MSNRQFHPERTMPSKDSWLSALTGQGASGTYPTAITARGEGGKFTPEGSVLPYPGNTFICHIDKTSDAYSVLCELQDQFMALPTAAYFTFLPKPSFHMTVFCGVSGMPLNNEGWPAHLPQGLSLEAVSKDFLDRIAELSGFSGVRVRADQTRAGYSLHVEPADAESNETLWSMRDRLRDLTGLHRADHDTYHFHISFAYRTRFMPEAVAKEHVSRVTELFEHAYPKLQNIQLGPVEFCVFENMHAFTPVKMLAPQ